MDILNRYVKGVKPKDTLYPVALLVILSSWYIYSDDLGELYSTYWPEATTMILGAFVAGSTPLGGGAVAYPVLTKLLDYSAENAQLFGVMIQSVGMTCASLLFIGLARRIYWKEILIATSVSLLVPLLMIPWINISDGDAKVLFTFFELLALFVLLFSLERIEIRNRFSKLTLLSFFALTGGLLTAILGTGADLMLFIYLVVFKRVRPIDAIPSTVIFMAINALFSFSSTVMYSEISTEIISAWLAAVPVVAIAAPLGAWVIGYFRQELVIGFIIALIIADLISTTLMGNVSINIILIVNVCLAIMLIMRYRKNVVSTNFHREYNEDT